MHHRLDTGSTISTKIFPIWLEFLTEENRNNWRNEGVVGACGFSTIFYLLLINGIWWWMLSLIDPFYIGLAWLVLKLLHLLRVSRWWRGGIRKRIGKGVVVAHWIKCECDYRWVQENYISWNPFISLISGTNDTEAVVEKTFTRIIEGAMLACQCNLLST